MALATLQERIHYHFRDESLLRLAVTHSSWANEHPGNAHNERLEFLGDAVLEISISAHLFDLFPEAREGDLTRLRSNLVNEKTLAELAREIRLDTVLLLARGEEHQGGRNRDALLADAMEAVFGAVFQDGGIDQARNVIERLYEHHWPRKAEKSRRKDYKTMLQEVTQRLHKALPVYSLEGTEGPEHAKVFAVRVHLPDGTSHFAKGQGLKRTEQEAARAALTALGEEVEETREPRPQDKI